MATAVRILCVCGAEVTDSAFARQAHERGRAHKAWVETPTTSATINMSFIDIPVGGQSPPLERLDPDLQTIVDLVDETPQMRAKMTRWAFSARGWPNTEHPGTVRDFLVAHNIPIV